jgi:hypothetical protein
MSPLPARFARGRARALVLGAAAVTASLFTAVHDGAHAAAPVGPLPFLPSIARVKVAVTKDRVVVTHSITLPRGDWKSGDLDLYVAHGAPGAPLALDAKLFKVDDGDLESREVEGGESVSSAHALLGRSKMAGVVVHLKDAAFRAATEQGMAELRVRALYTLPPEDAENGREVRVRLGTPGGTPLTLGRVQVTATDREAPVSRAEARLCGPDADTKLLALTLTPKPQKPVAPSEPPIAPVLSVRHATDDLCIRIF